MSICLICHKPLGMITESHMWSKHKISCKEYAKMFNLKKGGLNPHHSKKMSGEGNPRFGVVPSKETRQKISDIHKDLGKFKGKNNYMYGRTHTRETRKKISTKLCISMLGKGNPFYGKKHSEEARKKMSRIRKELGLSKGKNNPLFGIGHTEETKKKISQIKKKFYLENPDKHVCSIIAKNYRYQKKKGGYISKKQIEIFDVIKERFHDAQLNYPLKTKTGVYFADVGIPSMKLDIEYDCWYWHKDKNKDLIRDRSISQVGWKTIRFKDEEIDRYCGEELAERIFLLITNI